MDLADGAPEERRLAVGLLRLTGRGEDFSLVCALAQDEDQEVALEAREALADLYGCEELGATFSADIVAGSTPWILSRLVELRRCVVPRDRVQRRERAGKELWNGCPRDSRVRMARIVLHSCTLPVEEFPGAQDIEVLGTGPYRRSWMGTDGSFLFWSIAHHWEGTLVGLSEAVLNSGPFAEREVFWRLVADGLREVSEEDRDQVADALYEGWIDRLESAEQTWFFLLAMSRRNVCVRREQELRLAAELDWEGLYEGDHVLVYGYLRYLERVLGPVGAEFRPGWPGIELECQIDASAIREELRKPRRWDVALKRFVPRDD